jgi:hypothetical protein
MEERPTEEDGEEADSVVIELLPLQFNRQPDEDGVAVYRAEVDDRQAPGAPVYAVTVRVESPGEDAEARAAFEDYLAGMRAGFHLTAPIEGEEVEEDVPTFDPANELWVELELVEMQPPDANYGVLFAVGWSIPSGADGGAAASSQPASGAAGDAKTTSGKVRKYDRPHRYTADPRKSGRRLKRHVKVIATHGGGWITYGSSWMTNPRTDVWPTHLVHLRVRVVWVGTDDYLQYQLIGKFS